MSALTVVVLRIASRLFVRSIVGALFVLFRAWRFWLNHQVRSRPIITVHLKCDHKRVKKPTIRFTCQNASVSPRMNWIVIFLEILRNSRGSHRYQLIPVRSILTTTITSRITCLNQTHHDGRPEHVHHHHTVPLTSHNDSPTTFSFNFLLVHSHPD